MLYDCTLMEKKNKINKKCSVKQGLFKNLAEFTGVSF